MTLEQAIRVLCEIHTRDDFGVGFQVVMEPRFSPWITQDHYVKAWRVVREIAKLRTHPGEYPIDDSEAQIE